MDDTLSPSSSCSTLPYDGDILLDDTEIPTNSQFNEKNVIDFLKLICCNKRKTT
jgi:hypothetical protein